MGKGYVIADLHTHFLHKVGQLSLVNIIMTSGDACPTVKMQAMSAKKHNPLAPFIKGDFLNSPLEKLAIM